MSDDARATAVAVYRALSRRDVEDLVGRIADGVDVELAEGLPMGLGGPHSGRDALLGVWARLARVVDLCPEPHEIVAIDASRLVVTGTYVGTVHATGAELRAAFVHLLDVDDGRVVRWRQFTDTHLWHEALGDG